MALQAKIKVIKKKEIKMAEAQIEVNETPNQPSARELVSTVSNWVSDFQNRKRKETKDAIETFLIKQPQTNGA